MKGLLLFVSSLVSVFASFYDYSAADLNFVPWGGKGSDLKAR